MMSTSAPKARLGKNSVGQRCQRTAHCTKRNKHPGRCPRDRRGNGQQHGRAAALPATIDHARHGSDFAIYVARDNETPRGIAERFGVSVYTVLEMNTRFAGLSSTSKLVRCPVVRACPHARPS